MAALSAEPAVALMAAESEHGGIAVASGDGEARLHEENGLVEYDPGRRSLQMRRRLEGHARATGWSRRGTGPSPMRRLYLLDQFRTRRTGDLLVVAREGYDFRRPVRGAGAPGRPRQPVRVAHADTGLVQRAGAEQPLRTVDLFPAMLAWLGVPVPDGIDGESVWQSGAPAERTRSGGRGRGKRWANAVAQGAEN